MSRSLWRLAAAVLACSLVAAACGGGDGDEPAAPEEAPAPAPAPAETTPPEPPPPADPPPAAPAAAVETAQPEAPQPAPPEPPPPAPEPPPPPPEPEEPAEPLRIAFFGFAAANGFAQATWAGIEEGAAEIGAEVQFFDPVFDANTQISQIQDAITAGDWDAFIVQANDGNAVIPVIEEALAAGIPVIGEFTPIGPDFGTLEPQVEGLIFVGASPVLNGIDLGEMAIDACGDRDPCNVVFLEGFRALPLDLARTTAFADTVASAPNVSLVASVEGGYTPDSGLSAAQDVLIAHDDVHVMVGSDQSILGAEQAANDAGVDVLLIGNGGSRQAVQAVREGRWHATFLHAERDAGRKSFDIAVEAATGGNPPDSFDVTTLVPDVYGTRDVIEEHDIEGQWDAA